MLPAGIFAPNGEIWLQNLRFDGIVYLWKCIHVKWVEQIRIYNNKEKIGMEQEYATLREEILHLMQKRDEYTRFAYAVIAAIWTAGFAIKNA